MKTGWISLAAVCALVIGVYMCMAQSGKMELLSPNAADTYYNLLVQGFRAGQLSLKKEVPPGLAQLAAPYDPAVNLLDQLPPYRLNDLSRYHGRLYLYFGVTPALILFWPMLGALWRRYFAEVSVGVVAACVLALGLATGAPMLLSQADVYEV
ncbi:MAG: hypothetical protein ABSH14_09320, partial [Verrucomicrobiia bacterium]